MRTFIQTALLVTSLVTPVVAFAETPKADPVKKEAPVAKKADAPKAPEKAVDAKKDGKKEAASFGGQSSNLPNEAKGKPKASPAFGGQSTNLPNEDAKFGGQSSNLPNEAKGKPKASPAFGGQSSNLPNEAKAKGAQPAPGKAVAPTAPPPKAPEKKP